jgi:hypothetical protein
MIDSHSVCGSPPAGCDSSCNGGDSLVQMLQISARFPFYVVMVALFTLLGRTFQSRTDVHVDLERRPTPFGMRPATQRRAP